MDVPIAEMGTGLLSCLLGDPALALGRRGLGWGGVGLVVEGARPQLL